MGISGDYEICSDVCWVGCNGLVGLTVLKFGSEVVMDRTSVGGHAGSDHISGECAERGGLLVCTRVLIWSGFVVCRVEGL